MTSRKRGDVPNVTELALNAPPGTNWISQLAREDVPKALLDAVGRRTWSGEDDPVWPEIFDLLEGLGRRDFEAPWELSIFCERFGELAASDQFIYAKTYAAMEVISSDLDAGKIDFEEAQRRNQSLETDRSDEARYVLALSTALLRPGRPHAFDLELTPPPYRHPKAFLWSNLSIGGPNKLRVVAKPENPGTMVLSGEVEAATVEGAICRTERVFDEFLGAMRAVGVCRFSGAHLSSTTPVAVVKMTDSWRSSGESLVLRPLYTYRLRGAEFLTPELWEGDRRRLQEDGLSKALEGTARRVRKVLAGESAEARQLRTACRLAVNAEDSNDPGVTITLAFAALEGLLLDPSEKLETLRGTSEAVAHTLGRNKEERKELRKRVKQLYDMRSIFVHTGEVRNRATSLDEALDLMYRVVSKHIDQLPPVEDHS